MIQFYSPEIEATGLLPETESGHCVRVLRMKEGDRIYVTDGKGHRFECTILEAHPKHTAVEILTMESISPWWGFRLELCVAPPKNSDRIEWLVEKAVEIGVDRIVLMKCARSERKTLRTDRLEKIAVSAMNQSLKANKTVIEGPVTFKELITDGFAGFKCLGYCDSAYPLRSFSEEYEGGNVRILIGPEGDFTPEEVAMAVENGYMPVTFGGSRLRLETAALYSAVAAHVIGDLSGIKIGSDLGSENP
ncbi:MAG: 16S rRNA (uracil(1498)-N(3))-methyltransferase [Muribaculaceae bacterium]|nr:16S rRNA (uracil(1498)-N(3))-methyltransferase [Muribaculaceae bacterium]